VHNTHEYEPKTIRFYKGKIYVLLKRQLIVMSFPNDDFSSKKLKKLAYKTKSIYSDMTINHKGIFLFLRQASENEADGAYLVASRTEDVEETGEINIKDKRILEKSNLHFKNPNVLYKASFEYTGYSVFLLKHLASKFGGHVLSYLNTDAADMKSAAEFFNTPAASSHYKSTEYFETKTFLYYVNN
jgi:hypothetical protein